MQINTLKRKTPILLFATLICLCMMAQSTHVSAASTLKGYLYYYDSQPYLTATFTSSNNYSKIVFLAEVYKYTSSTLITRATASMTGYDAGENFGTDMRVKFDEDDVAASEKIRLLLYVYNATITDSALITSTSWTSKGPTSWGATGMEYADTSSISRWMYAGLIGGGIIVSGVVVYIYYRRHQAD